MITVPTELEHSFLQLAEIEHRPVSKLIESALNDYLKDYYDARMTEAAISRIQRGEGELIALTEAERMLNEMDD